MSEQWWKAALRATYPSTLGLVLLAAISLAFSAVLAAVLAGVIAVSASRGFSRR